MPTAPDDDTGQETETRYTSYGPHPFVVQIRDPETHQPLPGIIIGDVGPKHGFAPMDNGYMLFDNFRVPHSAFLARYARVDPKSGIYSKPQNPALVYGSLTRVRSWLVTDASMCLARALTIAVRYTSIRRQFRDRDSDGSGAEMAVLDYPTVQSRILPLLATIFALLYSGRAMAKLYNRTRQGADRGDFSELADMHSTSSGLKSMCTTLAADGVETCRRACGGHGYSSASGFIQLNNDYSSKVTVEGENWMITQQLAAYLIKKAAAALEFTETAESVIEQNLRDFLRRKKCAHENKNLDIFKSDQTLVLAFQLRTADLVSSHPFKAQQIL